MSATESLERAVAAFRQVLAGVSKDDLDTQSTCGSWKVRDIINHVVEGSDFFVPGLGGEPAGFDDPASGDYHGAYDDAAARTLAAFNAPGALEKAGLGAFDGMPATTMLAIATTDIFTHAWDLANTTGQSTDLDPELAAQALARAEGFISDSFRGPEGSGKMFGPKQEAPAGATNADKLAAFLGRRV